jgi:hypothetical protein
MRTYDPADSIRYVHPGQIPAAAPHTHDECHRLPAGYANASLGVSLGPPRPTVTRPALVLLPGGPAAADTPAPAAPALRRAR